MNIVVYFAGLLLVAVVLGGFLALLEHSREGYEDQQGFHFGNQPGRRAK